MAEEKSIVRRTIKDSVFCDLFADTEENIYGSKRVDIPRPEFYVVYTGSKKCVKEWYSLSDEFFDGDSSFIDIRVRVLRADEGSKDIVTQYVTFTKILDDQVKKIGRTEDAVREAIRICKDQDVLAEYLGKNEQEVISIMTTLFSQEEATEMYGNQLRAEGRAEGKAEGRAEGEAKGKILGSIDMARKMKMPESQIVQYLMETFNLTKEEAETQLNPMPA